MTQQRDDKPPASWCVLCHRRPLCCLLTALVICSGSYFILTSYRAPDGVIIDNDIQDRVVLPADSCPTEILCGLQTASVATTPDMDQLKQQFYSLVSTVDGAVCQETKHFGQSGDGGYDVCVSPARFQPPNCLVYSFGINKDWSFDEAMSQFGCEVHSFDPSIGLSDHVHAPNVHFHALGLWGNDLVNKQNWTLRSLDSIRRQLGHHERMLDVLKVDVEGAEWPFLRDVTSSPSQLESIGQLLMELHTPRVNPDRLVVADLQEIIEYVRKLDAAGFKLFRNVQRNWCCARFAPLMPYGTPEKCCHETFYVNAKLKHKL